MTDASPFFERPILIIVVCNNTSTSKLVHEWISGWQRPVAEDSEELRTVHHGHLSLFGNSTSTETASPVPTRC